MRWGRFPPAQSAAHALAEKGGQPRRKRTQFLLPRLPRPFHTGFPPLLVLERGEIQRRVLFFLQKYERFNFS